MKPAFFRMTIEERAECVADTFLGVRGGHARGGEKWTRVRKKAEQQLREAVAQALADAEAPRELVTLKPTNRGYLDGRP